MGKKIEYEINKVPGKDSFNKCRLLSNKLIRIKYEPDRSVNSVRKNN